MTPPRVGVLGAGAAGTAAAKTLHATDPTIQVELIARTGEQPLNRTLVNKGISIGLLTPEQATLPAGEATLIADTVRSLDPRTRRVHLASGQTRDYDGIIVATGSRARALGEDIPGRDEALASGRLTTLHSPADATAVRDQLAALTGPGRVLILGGGLLAAETASLFAAAGHDIALVARSSLPGSSAVGEQIAHQLLQMHQARVETYTGRSIYAVRTHPDRITLVLDDGDRLEGDLAIIAHGTLPAAPSPWTGPDGIPVDDRLRLADAPEQRIYAAGGLTRHHHPRLGAYRVDHWDDAAAQGAHAARTLLHDHDLGEDPGSYRPASTFTASIHGRILAGAGHPTLGTTTQVVCSEPTLLVHQHDETPVAVTGLDDVALVHQWAPRLHQPQRTLDAEN